MKKNVPFSPQITIRLCEAGKPIFHRLPFGSVRLLGLLGGGQDSCAWDAHPRPIKIFWDADLLAWIQVDLRDWGGRWHYFPGRYYDQSLPWIMRQYLKSGDLFIDVGANFGLHTIRAVHIVGATDRVIAIEPSPAALKRLRLHLLMNDIANVEVVPTAVGSHEGQATLHIDPMHLGTASLREAIGLAQEVTVPVGTLDSIVSPQDDSRRALVKIDVEGLELDVVAGASGWLERNETAFVVEVTPEWIESGGRDSRDLFELFRARGYQAFLIGRSRRYGTKIQFTCVREPQPHQADYLFIAANQATHLAWL